MQVGVLGQLIDLWRDVPFVLVGAAAVQCHLKTDRETHDLDIVLAVAVEELPAGLDRLDGWQRHPRFEHRWSGPGDAQLDLVPGGPELLRQGHVDWPSGYRMRLIGLEHAFARAVGLAIPGGVLRVADLASLALLKMVAFQDRPADRERDLIDLAFVMEGYIGDDDDRRWEAPATTEQLPVELVAPYLLGFDMAGFATERDRQVISRFLALALDENDSLLERMRRRAPISWRSSDDAAGQRIIAFQRGFRRA